MESDKPIALQFGQNIAQFYRFSLGIKSVPILMAHNNVQNCNVIALQFDQKASEFYQFSTCYKRSGPN